jgi:hypothetical protein
MLTKSGPATTPAASSVRVTSVVLAVVMVVMINTFLSIGGLPVRRVPGVVLDKE